MTTTKSYDYLNRLTSISSQPSASGLAPFTFDYSYNDANQRTRVNMADGSFWIYEYDKLGQVISGKRYWNDWTPVAGQQYEYAFDDIGNRSSTKAGGDSGGAALRSASYTANALNQYTSRDVPAYLNVLGIAHANASVTVNGQSPYRRGEYFRQELSANNASAALWQSATNIASLSGSSQTNTGNLFLPKTAETYTYDLDGNLTSDGRWTNRWDGENRLVDMTSHSSGPSGSRKSLQFAYDSKSRRYSMVVSNWTGSAWTRALHEKFVYDGWNLLGALNGTNNAIVRSFLWGLDLSGSLQGAGGVGGLICFKHHSGSLAGAHFAAYDGNGNVTALVDASTGAASARYEYDPFGQTIRASGMAATLNPVRFSSKPIDDETDLAYYGYRYFNPNRGKWLSRDPIGERGGKNVYEFLQNSTVNSYDKDGRLTVTRVGEEIMECDSVTYLFRFTLDNPMPCDEGYLVQENSVYRDDADCTKASVEPPARTLILHMWEAFPMKIWIDPFSFTSPYGAFTDGVRYRGFPNSSGAYRAVGTIKFFCKDETGNLGDVDEPGTEPGWTPGVPSGGLPMTHDEPSWWNSGAVIEGPATRTVTIEWDCCPCRRRWNSSATP